MAKIISYRNFDVNGVEFTAPKISRNNNKTITLKYPNNETWFIQTPKSFVPFKPYDTNFCISVNDVLETKIREFEDYIVKSAVENSVSWFDAAKTEEEIKTIYTSMLNQTSTDYPPFMRLNFAREHEVYDPKGEMTDKNSIEAKIKIRAIVKFAKLYIRTVDGNLVMKCIVELEQGRICSKASPRPTTYAFLDESEDEN